MKAIFEGGGFIMYILLFASILALGIVLEKFYYYFKYEKKSKNSLGISKGFNNSIERLISLLEKENKKSSKTNYLYLEEKAREFTLDTMLKLDNKLWILNLIANLSTMMGLFGTVTGMISAFNVIAVAGTGDPKLLADGISKALITTAGGLSVGMPTMVFANYFGRKSDEAIEKMEKAAVTYLNKLRSDEHEL